MDASIRDTSGTYQPWAEDSPKKEKSEVEETHSPITFQSTVPILMLTGPLNILLLCCPISIIAYAADWPSAVIFIFSLLAIAPLAERLGFVTEQIAFHTNDTIGGLINATFGNATELIVAITALKRGMYRLVQLSLLGSILSNMLLVLGFSFAFGGYYHKTQTFGTISSQMNSTLLMLATMGILLPTILTDSNEETNLSELGYSRATSVMLFCLYFAFLYFQLFSHRHLYEDEPSEQQSSVVRNTAYTPISDSDAPQIESAGDAGDVEIGAGAVATSAGTSGTAAQDADKDSVVSHGDVDDDDEDQLGLNNALIWLTVITVLIAIISDAISYSIGDAAEKLGMSKVFISAVLLPIVGNAAEHASAVMFAVKNKLDLSLGVCIGSSTQIALCVLPLLVIISWIGGYELSLNFGGFEATTLLLATISVTFAIKDGKSNWLLGVTLVAAYAVVAVGFWAHNNDDLDSKP